jgi:L-threonylcarbamoyladenylate synthase
MTPEERAPRRTERLGSDAAGLGRAVELLRAGELVAFPTETVYGLGARADDPAAIARVFAAKGRPADNPLIVHVAALEELDRVAADITPLARTLLAHFAPGPLTVVLKARPDVPSTVTGGLDTVAVRIPDHPVALALLRALDLPLAAPSANRSSRPSPTTAAHVLADLDGVIAAVIDGGPTSIGLESTVVDARGTHPLVLREGGVSREDLRALLGDAPAPGGPDAPEEHRSPGTRHAHYVPRMPVHLSAPGEGPALVDRLLASAARPSRIGLVRVTDEGARPVPTGVRTSPKTVVLLAELSGPRDLAARLFGLLREAEDAGCDALVVEGVAPVGVGRAVMDRLQRAAAGATRAGGGATPS